MAKSTTQLSIEWMLKRGFMCDVTERWIPRTKIRKDLFGFIDMLAAGMGQFIGVQTTTKSNVSSRIKKIIALPSAKKWIIAGGMIEVHGWFKVPKGAFHDEWDCVCRHIDILDFDNETPKQEDKGSGRRPRSRPQGILSTKPLVCNTFADRVSDSLRKDNEIQKQEDKGSGRRKLHHTSSILRGEPVVHVELTDWVSDSVHGNPRVEGRPSEPARHKTRPSVLVSGESPRPRYYSKRAKGKTDRNQDTV